jgi:GT2 family glycosyltransferase
MSDAHAAADTAAVGRPIAGGGNIPLVHAVAVTHRRPETLMRTLDAFRAQTRPPDSILVVDNAADETVRDLVTKDGVGYLAMPENVGPAGAIAAGMRATAEVAGPDDWILLIDDDDPPRFPTAVEDVVSLASRVPADVALVGLTGPRYDRWTGRLRRIPDDRLTDLTDVDYVGNNQVPLYRVRAIREVGVFDPGIFIFSEELDYALRLRAAGWRAVISREATLRLRAATGRAGLGTRARADRRRGGWRSYYAARNEVLVARRHARPTAPVVVTVRVVAGGAVAALRERSLSVLGPRLRGVVDGWAGRTGRRVDP